MDALGTIGYFRQQPGVHFGQAEVQHNRISLDAQNQWQVPDHVRVPYMEGDGIGPEVMRQARRLVDATLEQVYQGRRSIEWVTLQAGEKALEKGLGLIPQDTIDAIQSHHIVVKGPLNTPVGKGFRSINVQLRKLFELFACIRPIRPITGVESPMKSGGADVVIFRENTEDVYAGVEFESGQWVTQLLIAGINLILRFTGQAEKQIRPDSAIGIKPISPMASKRLVARAFDYALENNLPSVTIVHKGNIMKHTEGAFWNWAQELARDKYGDQVILQDAFWRDYGGDFEAVPEGKFVLKDRIADAMLQDIILNPQTHHVVATTNLNGDYLSDAFAATVGGLGVSPGANHGETHALFEATHGSAPDIAGQDKANPTAMFLTMVMMLNAMGWGEAADRMLQAMESALAAGEMTGDLARYVDHAEALSTTEYTDAVIGKLESSGGDAASQ